MTTKRQLPPGPSGIPIFGYLPYIFKEGGFARIADKYGEEHKSDVVLIDAWFAKVVIVNTFDLIKDTFGTRDDVAVRTRVNMFTKFHPGHQGFIFCNGDVSKEHREFVMNALSEAGIGKVAVEKCVADELQYFQRAVEATDEKPTNPHEMITRVTANVMSALMFGERYSYDDEEFLDLMKSMDMATSRYGHSFFMSPWMWRLPKFLDILGIQAQQRNMDHIFKFLGDKIKGRQSQFDLDDIRCYIDAYLFCKHQGRETFTDDQLCCEIFDLIFGSGETTRATLLWAFNYMARYPKIQDRVQRELDEKIGRDHLPTMADKPQLPYTDAVFMEVQRIASVTPSGAFHCDDENDLEIGGYRIPKGSYIGANVYHVHHDPNIWKDPDNFNPNNFFNEEEGTVEPSDKLIPFGYGRRICVGQNVAKTIIFLMFTRCLHRFRVESADPEELEGPPVGAIEHPSPYKVSFKKRDE